MYTRSSDGLTLLMTSSDGFCSTLSFAENELGVPYTPDASASTNKKPASLSLSSQNTPIPTPVSAIAPPSPFHLSNNHQRSSSQQSNPIYPYSAPTPPTATAGFVGTSSSLSTNPPSFFGARPSSPTRSNSTSSIATQASIAHLPSGTVISNPQLVSGSVPGVTASVSGSVGITGSGKAGVAGVSTPPETPRSTASSIAGNKRDASGVSESEDNSDGKAKKRRIAPTPVDGPQ